MAAIQDVAQAVLEQAGPMTTMKLQKLVYYCQAWHIAWHDIAIFNSRIEAWADGPVAPELFNRHRGAFRISSIANADATKLSPKEKATVKKIVEYYGDKSPQWLSDLTHQEDPWRLARAGIPDRAPCNNEITKDSLARYYSSL